MDHHHQQQQQQNKRPRAVEAGSGGQNHPPPQPCPRCNSGNTKFCYFNNYSLSQPRFFCKGCRRYWTQGGTLRNVPVGGGCRKSKRPKSGLTGPGTSTGSGSSGLGQIQVQPQPPLISSGQLLRPPLSMMVNPNNTINSNIISTSSNNNTINNMGVHGYYGGGNSGFLSSLSAIQGMNPNPNSNQNHPLGFGSNLGSLHGFGLPSFDNQPGIHQGGHNQEVSLPSLYSSREVGSSSTPTMQEWADLRVGPGLPDASNASSDNNRNQDNNNGGGNGQSNQQWSNFMGTSGLDDP